MISQRKCVTNVATVFPINIQLWWLKKRQIPVVTVCTVNLNWVKLLYRYNILLLFVNKWIKYIIGLPTFILICYKISLNEVCCVKWKPFVNFYQLSHVDVVESSAVQPGIYRCDNRSTPYRRGTRPGSYGAQCSSSSSGGSTSRRRGSSGSGASRNRCQSGLTCCTNNRGQDVCGGLCYSSSLYGAWALRRSWNTKTGNLLFIW